MKQKAVFLDRDGVINNGDLYYTYKVQDFIFIPDIFEALYLLQEKGFLLFVITNQGGISKGVYTHEDVRLVHQYMLDSFKKKNIDIQEVYYCPHHDSIEKCICRKPDSGNIEKAIARFNIDISQSYMIGDSERDILAGKKAGLKTFKIEKNDSILQICQQIAVQ
jgi:D,D-heptose 1,7-bisphosphate phosphatase